MSSLDYAPFGALGQAGQVGTCQTRETLVTSHANDIIQMC